MKSGEEILQLSLCELIIYLLTAFFPSVSFHLFIYFIIFVKKVKSIEDMKFTSAELLSGLTVQLKT